VTEREDEPPADARSWVRRHPLVLVVAVAVVAAVVVFTVGGDDRPEESGEQLAGPTARIAGAGNRPWVEVIPQSGEPREGWPPPMIARGTEVCFGFGRVDFGPPTRPTLARCVEAAEIPEPPANGLVSLVVIDAGNDAWHLLLAGGDVDSAGLTAADGTEIDPERVHVDGDLLALRLSRTVDLADLSWIVGRARIRCAPPAGAAVSGQFCAAG
ncbi:MAG: hypothetical protein ACR2O6_11120, partial [Ilumatobacteraceae bacterium]